MTAIDTKLYPTEANVQLPPGDMPVRQYIAWLERFVKSAPDLEEGSAVIRHHENVELWYQHARTELESANATLAALRQELIGAGRDPLAERLLLLLG